MLRQLQSRWLLLIVFAISTSLIGQSPSIAVSTTGGWQPQPDSEDAVYLPLITSAEPHRIFLGIHFDPTENFTATLSQFEQLVGRKHGIYHYFTYWGYSDFNGHKLLLDQITGYGATPMITFMSIPQPGDAGCDNPNWNLDSIISGNHDQYLNNFARQASRYRHDILMRWGHEMNLSEYSWSGYCNGANTTAAEKYVQAYQHIVNIFRENNANNIHWVWSPYYRSFPSQSWNNIENYYPGDDYVDWIGVTGYNYPGWFSFEDLFDEFLRNMSERHPTIPVMLVEFASTESNSQSKSQWISNAFHAMRNYSNLKASVWFHKDRRDYSPIAHFRIDSTQSSLNAYRTAVQDSIFVSERPYHTLPLPPPSPTGTGVHLGAYFDPQFDMVGEMQAFEALVGRKHGIYHFYTYWGFGDFTQHRFLLNQIVRYGALPMISFMSIPGPGDAGCSSNQWNLDSINRGDHDTFLRIFASQIAQYPAKFLLRWGHEMNLGDYSWSGYCNGGNIEATQKFIAAYRRIVDIFRNAGATNVRWIWSPSFDSWPAEPWNAIENYYPGDDYVDWIGVVGYNFGQSRVWSGYHWDTFDDLFRIFLEDAQQLHPDKPVMLADYATAENDGGDKAAWITDAFTEMKRYPNLKAAVYFHLNPPEYSPPTLYFKIDSSLASLEAYRAAIQDDYFLSEPPTWE
ncbi:MAG: glycoside hydrolase family 26 protein [Caldilinea sp.]